MTSFSNDEVVLISECAAMEDRDAAWQRLNEAFRGRGQLVLAQAVSAADKLTRFDEAVDVGDGQIVMRVRETFRAAGIRSIG